MSAGGARGTMTRADQDAWEAAYLRFETPAQEIRKFVRRLRRLGADHWPRNACIVDLFSGRGNGLHALHRLGFSHIEGVDLSPTLAARYDGPGTVHVGDCRNLPFDDNSKDIAIVQGGLHHLRTLPDDLEMTLLQVRRILGPHGRFIVVEPWRTPFLRAVHALSRRPLIRRLSPKFDAFETMFEHERETYEQWLSHPPTILGLLEAHFETDQCFWRWGRLMFVGRKRTAARPSDS